MKQRSGEKITLLSVDELLGVPSGDPITEIDVDRIYPFENHPFKVADDERMEELIESIRYNGVLTPVVVRVDKYGDYEMISGHRRLFAVNKIGLPTIPATIKEMDDAEAVIAMVDSNIQRDEILPSEKAFAYRMRYEAMKKKEGRPKKLSQVGTVAKTESKNGRGQATDELLAQQVGESRNQIHRYIRLTELIPELLNLVDRGNIAIMTGVDISHVEQKIQKWLYEYIKENGTIKSYQITALRDELKMNPDISQKDMIEILNNNQPGRMPSMRINFTSNQLRKYFPAYYSSQEAKAIIEELLTNWKKEQDKRSKVVK